MKPIICACFLLYLGGGLQACAQSKNFIVKSSGYFMIPAQGTIEVDDIGEPISKKRDSVFLVIVETKSGNIDWAKAWRGDRSFSIIPSQIKEKLVVGFTRLGNKPIEIAPSSGNFLWRLELSDDQAKEKLPQQITSSEILISGFKNNKRFVAKTNTVTELASPLYQ